MEDDTASDDDSQFAQKTPLATNTQNIVDVSFSPQDSASIPETQDILDVSFSPADSASFISTQDILNVSPSPQEKTERFIQPAKDGNRAVRIRRAHEQLLFSQKTINMFVRLVSVPKLVVRESTQQHDSVFSDKTLGLGLFMPADCGGVTTDLIFDGVGVLHIPVSLMEPWQRDYAITDTFSKKDDSLFTFQRINSVGANYSERNTIVSTRHTCWYRIDQGLVFSRVSVNCNEVCMFVCIISSCIYD